MLTALAAVLCLGFSPAAASAATRYISPSGSDTSTCATAATPCKTFNRAYQISSPGDTVIVGAGNYGDQTISPKSGAAAPQIVFSPAPGAAVTVNDLYNTASYLRINGPMTFRRAITGPSSSKIYNVTLDGLTINGQNYNGDKVVGFEDVSNFTLSNSDVSNNRNMSLMLGSGDHVTIDHSKIHDAGLDAGSGAHTECLYATGISYLRITNSHFYRCAVMDVFITRWSGTTTDPQHGWIENNVFEKPWSTTGVVGNGYAFHFRNGGEPAPDIYDWDFRHNTFAGPLSFGTPAENLVQPSGLRVNGNIFLAGTACRTGAYATYAYNIYAGGTCGGTGEISSTSSALNAGFVGPTTQGNAGNNFRLTLGSPAIDRGDGANYPAGDFDGNARYAGLKPDLGAFEYGATSGGGGDTTPPDTTITSGPSGSTTSTSASLAFSATESATFACRIDGGAWGGCNSPASYSGLAVGSHTFDVRAADLAGNIDPSPASSTWTVTAPADTTPPNTSITSAPSGSTTATSASLAFSATEAVTFDCRMDGGAWTACTSPKAYSGLALGAHTFDVRATDLAGNVDLTPASAAWTVVAAADTTPPDTSIVSGPSGSTTSTSASLAFSATESATFECRMDGGSWTACTSPKSYGGLALGAHTFDVRATDAAGNTDLSPASRAWTVAAPADTTAPDTSITSGPSGSGTDTSAALSFTATEAGSTFECRLDGGTWASCASPKSYSAMAAGSHTFDVRATDAAGNTDASPASRSWTVVAPADTTAPDTTITSGPPASTTATTASVSFTATEAGSTFQCRLDSGAWAACASPEGDSGLSVGAHRIDVRATDGAGNVDATPASWSWTVVAPAPPPPAADTTAPDTQLTSGPTTVTTQRSATFEFKSTEMPAVFSCSLDSSRWSACTAPKSYSSLSRGKHTIRVRATDAAGNTDATPVTYSWSIVRRTWGTTYSFEPLSGRSSAPVQADSLEGACALVSNSRARLGVRLRGLNVRRSQRAIRVSGKVPELARDGVNARIRVSVRSHGRWHLLVSRRVHVRFDGSFRVKAPRRSGKLKVTAIARCG